MEYLDCRVIGFCEDDWLYSICVHRIAQKLCALRQTAAVCVNHKVTDQGERQFWCLSKWMHV